MDDDVWLMKNKSNGALKDSWFRRLSVASVEVES